VVAAYEAAARRLGVRFCEHAEVLDIVHSPGTVEAVSTGRGVVRTERVVCAAGAWSARIGAMVGVHLPVEPVRRQIGLTSTGTAPAPAIPFTLDLGTTLYFHGHDTGLLLGISDPLEKPGFDRGFTRDWLPAFDRAAAVVAPSLCRPELTAGWAGLYENTPDHNALIGTAPGLPGFAYATGFSGHGFLQAPAVGELIRDLYLGREPFMDATAFSADRFTDAAGAVREVHII
jgi:sarcosine oxidase subunit beta